MPFLIHLEEEGYGEKSWPPDMIEYSFLHLYEAKKI